MANAEVDALDFEDDDLMDEDGTADVDASSSPRAPQPKLKSAITGGAPKKTKGRGFREEADSERNSRLADRNFESLGTDGGPGSQRSIEGWIILVAGVHEEAQEDDLQNSFGEFGEIKNLHLNLDRRIGFVKGYALIEYEHFEEAQNAITAMNGTKLLTQTLSVHWAFSNGPSTGPFKRKNMSLDEHIAQGVRGEDADAKLRTNGYCQNRGFSVFIFFMKDFQRCGQRRLLLVKNRWKN